MISYWRWINYFIRYWYELTDISLNSVKSPKYHVIHEYHIWTIVREYEMHLYTMEWSRPVRSNYQFSGNSTSSDPDIIRVILILCDIQKSRCFTIMRIHFVWEHVFSKSRYEWWTQKTRDYFVRRFKFRTEERRPIYWRSASFDPSISDLRLSVDFMSKFNLVFRDVSRRCWDGSVVTQFSMISHIFTK